MMIAKKRRTIVFPAIRLEFVKSIKKKAKVTINDILLSVVTGAIRIYCEKSGDIAMQSKFLENRCTMTVSLPRSSDELADPSRALRNHWVMISVPIPIASGTAKERLCKCNITTSENKKSPTAGIQMWLQQILPKILPVFLQQKTAYDIFSRHTCSFSNIPGPPEVIFLGGEPMEGLQVIFPTIIPTVVVISYAGGIYLNMNIDDNDLPGAADELPRYYIEEIKELATKYSLATDFMMTDSSSEGFINS